MHEIKGKIVKGIGGFYYVMSEGQIVECKAKGAFRSKSIVPIVGDNVSVKLSDGVNGALIDEIFERKNFLLRPPVSNIDKLFIVCSTALPSPNFLNIDKLCALAVFKNIEPIIVISKTDLKDSKEISDVYKKTSMKVFEIRQDSSENIDEIKDCLKNCVCAFTGNSGVGKTTLLNKLSPDLSLKTGEISKKLSRGKHTTRHVELFALDNGGFIADTPGFSSIDFENCGVIMKEDLPACFEEFSPFVNNCAFADCAHINEKNCAVKEAVENDIISKSRYESFCSLYKDAQKIKTWEIKK